MLVLMCSLIAYQILEYVPAFLKVEARSLEETVAEIGTKLRALAGQIRPEQ